MPSTRCCTTMRGAGADALTLPEYAHRPSPNRPECATLGGRIEGADRAIAAAARWEIRCMLLPLDGRRLYYDLAGPESGPVVGFTHSLSSDSGMWAEQVPTPLAADSRYHRRHHRARLSWLRGGDPEFRLCAAPADAQDSDLGRLRRRRSRHTAEREQADRRARPRRPLRGDRKGAPSPECRAPGGVQPHHDGLARRTPLAHPGRRKSVVPG